MTSRRWALCVLLFLATTLNYLDRQTVSVLAPSLRQELQLDNVQLGWLFSAFYWSYTAGQFLVGLALDRFSLRWLYGGGVVLWSVVAMATGISSGFWMLLVFRVLLGLAESGNWPGALRIIARVMEPRERPVANGLFTSGTSVGALIAPVLILSLAAWYGWRWAFAGVGALGIVWFLAWVPVSRGIRFGEPTLPIASPVSAWREIFTLRKFWLVFAVTSLMNPCLYYFVNWTPTYLAQIYGVQDRLTLTKILTAVFLGLDLGYLLCGVSVVLLMKFGLRQAAARRVVMSVATLLLGAALLLARTPDFLVAIACLVICNFACGAWIAMYLTLAQEVSHQHLATAAGLLGGAGSLFGALAMNGVGSVTQATSSYAIPFMAVTLAAIAATGAGWKAAAEETAPV